MAERERVAPPRRARSRSPNGTERAGPGGHPGGESLAPSVARPIQRSLGVDTSGVRVHSGAGPARTAQALGARAFAYGRDVFLGGRERPTDLPLVAHEVAHIVQQQGAPALQRAGGRSGDRYEREADSAAGAVTRGERFTVRERTPPRVQRLGLSDVLDYFADKANAIPGFRMFTIILGVNPVNMSRVERSAANIMRAVVEFLPGGYLITQALDNHGIFEQVGGWVEQQIKTLGMTGSIIREAINRFLDSLGWRDIFDLGGVWDRAKRIFSEPIRRLIDFATGLVTGIIRFIKDAILRPLAKLAEGTRGWDLLKAVLGEDPITGERVPRTADTLIGGFMKLIGQEEVWENIKKAKAIPRAWAWFQGALQGLLGFVRGIPALFISALQQLELMDIVMVPRAFKKIGRVFGGFILSFLSWAGQQVLSLLQIIFEVVAPAVMPYLRKAMGAFKQIVSNPIGFIKNLVRAGIQGFKQFGSNFLTHLRTSLIQWLTGTLSGANIYIPKAFELREIVKFVLSVLGLTWDNVRGKLVKVIGETAAKALETGFDIVVTLVKEGPAAAWEKIKEQLTNLREMVIEQVMTFAREKIVSAAITKLLTSLNPAGAFIQAVIAIYNTVMFFVERLKQIAQVAMSFIDAIAEIAAGGIGTAAKRVEDTMAGLLTLVISFLARLVGLGNVSEQVVKIVNKLRAPIDKALDKVIEWIVKTAKRVLAGLTKRGEPDGEASKGLKQAVKVELTGKSVADEKEASGLLTAIYQKFAPRGLKGLRLVYDPKAASVGIKASASVVEVVANLPVQKRSLTAVSSFASEFHYMSGRTVLHVHYDLDNKRYGDVIENQPEPVHDHAEQVFKRQHLAGLKQQIAADRAAGRIKTPPGQPVRVLLELNRLPCTYCTPLLASLATSERGQLQFVVNASSASNTTSTEVTIDYIEKLLEADIEVDTLKIFEALRNKFIELLQAAKAEQIKRVTETQYHDLAHTRQLIDANLSKEKHLQEMIAEAKKRVTAKKALAKVPPVGSGV